jgi:23S rRNA (guanosine2251-2'-O)-methyltransferase
MTPSEEQFIYGINPVAEFLKSSSRKCHKVVVEEDNTNPRVQGLAGMARSLGVKVEVMPKAVFRRKYQDLVHQGVAAHIAERELLDLDTLIQQAFAAEKLPVLALLDGIEDPQNLGAIIRSALVLGIQGVVVPKHRSAPINPTVTKAAAGAVERLPIALATNLVQAVEQLKKAGFWAVAADADGDTPCHDFRFDTPIALVIGGEGKGIRPLLRKSCDFSVAIPMCDSLGSLNASASAAVLFYEILRQKSARE